MTHNNHNTGDGRTGVDHISELVGGKSSLQIESKSESVGGKSSLQTESKSESVGGKSKSLQLFNNPDIFWSATNIVYYVTIFTVLAKLPFIYLI